MLYANPNTISSEKFFPIQTLSESSQVLIQRLRLLVVGEAYPVWGSFESL